MDHRGNLLVCEGSEKQVVVIDAAGTAAVLAHEYNSLALNEPNDIWGAPDGGIYFTDPVYNGTQTQDSEHVYYLSRESGQLIRVIDDMTKPNGIVGTADGKALYVTDPGAGETYRYEIESDGTLSKKQLFAATGGDGMTLDDEGNVYLCQNGVLVYDAAGNMREEIPLPEQPTNVCFGGEDGHTLFITTRNAVYSLKMRVGGVFYSSDFKDPVPDIKANGSDGPLIMSTGDILTIAVTLDTGAGHGRNADWWVAAYADNLGWWSYVYPKGWVEGIIPCVQAPLCSLSSTVVLKSALPAGIYSFYFAVDDNADGNPDVKWLVHVKVEIIRP